MKGGIVLSGHADMAPVFARAQVLNLTRELQNRPGPIPRSADFEAAEAPRRQGKRLGGSGGASLISVIVTRRFGAR